MCSLYTFFESSRFMSSFALYQMVNREQQTNNGQIHGNDHVSLETIFEILNKFGLNAVTKNFQNEKVDMKVVMPASDEDSIRLGVRTIGERIRLREACRRDYTANSLLRQLGIIQEISTDRPGLDERLFLFSPSFGRIMEVVRRREEKGAVVLLVAVIEWQQISVYNQLTSSSSGNSQPDELTQAALSYRTVVLLN